MGIKLERINGNQIGLSNTIWGYLLNLGELYGWKPEGTIKPKNYGFFKTWKGNYDSSDGQTVKRTDSINLSDALNNAILDKEFELKSNSLIKEIQEAIERSIGHKLGYNVLPDIKIEFIKDVIKFLQDGEFIIN